MNKNLANIWEQISAAEKRNIFKEAAIELNIPDAAIEKDWWVVRTLEIIFQTEIAPHTVFKGGTSLSKAWSLIDRFSEDIDLALDRSFLGFNKDLTGSQVSKLRKHSFKYLSSTYLPQLQKALQNAGFGEVKLQLSPIKSTDEDPVKIEVIYPALTEKWEYLPQRILIEIGCRSLREPFSQKQFSSFVGMHFREQNFADTPVTIPTVNPERTFLEKIFLLHEEFQQVSEKIRTERKSRHLYDLEKLMDTEFAAKALADKDLYQQIVEHRRAIIPIRGINYDDHTPDKINPVPPVDLIPAWKKDYELMQQSMIYTESLPFDKLMERIGELKMRINKIA